MKKIIAELKRDISNKKLYGTIIDRVGGVENMPDRLKGERPLVRSNSVAVFFLNADGRESELRVNRASLVEYTGDTLTTYYAGYREPNEKEQKALDEWQKITKTEQYQKDMEYDCYTDSNRCYYQQKRSFRDKGLEYLMGVEEQRGLKLDYNKRNAGEKAFIRDKAIKGEVELKYSIREAV